MIIVCLKKEGGEIVHQMHFHLFRNIETETWVVPSEFLIGLTLIYPEYDILIFQTTGQEQESILSLLFEDAVWTDALEQTNTLAA